MCPCLRRGPVCRRQIGEEKQFATRAELLPVRRTRFGRRVVGDEDARTGHDYPEQSTGGRTRRGFPAIGAGPEDVRPHGLRRGFVCRAPAFGGSLAGTGITTPAPPRRPEPVHERLRHPVGIQTEIGEKNLGGVVAGKSRDIAARMAAGSAQVQPVDTGAVFPGAGEWPVMADLAVGKTRRPAGLRNACWESSVRHPGGCG